MVKKITTFTSLLVFLIANSDAGDKRWMNNTNFDNKDNWRRGEVPCESDRIILPRKSPVISVLKDVYITDAYLPTDGELLINDGVSFFGVPPEQMHSASCHGKDAKFTRQKALSWFDPANWCVVTSGGQCVQTGVHASMVPSQFDKVTFPNPRDSYLVDVDYDDNVVIQGLNYRLKWQTTHGFRTYVSSPEGRRQFVNTQDQLVPTIALTRKGCADRSGCVPNTLQKRLFAKICSKVTCPAPACDRPFHIHGSCCGWCGSQVLVATADDFSFTSLQSQIRLQLADGVQADVLKVAPKTVQIALTDELGGKRASKAVVDVAKMLREKQQSYGIASFQVKSSSGSMTSYDYHTGGTKRVPIILGVLFGLLALVIVVVLAFEVNRRVRNGQLTLPQLQNLFIRTSPSHLLHMSWRRRSDGVGMEMQTTMATFDNPVYRTADISVTPIDDLYDEPIATIIGGSLTNPAYQPEPARTSKTETAPEPGSIVIKRKEKIEIINKAYDADPTDPGDVPK